MNTPSNHQLALFNEAVTHFRKVDYETYLKLKQLFAEKTQGFEKEFQRLFVNYYGLNTGGVTEEFKNRYFELLFGLKLQEGVDPYDPILRELYKFPRRQGTKALQCSFVSKMVAFHDEMRPIFDKHVGVFFNIALPSKGILTYRITDFIGKLEQLRQTYSLWSKNDQFQKIIQIMIEQHPLLKDCAIPRLADFLVWSVGHYKIDIDDRGTH